ncbi:MAG: hypothetical protein L3J29_03155, partial [Cyclobacteriaceae bacterium]|nr:hypothetical protein [Cyclobacteriaceae bacterium]
TTRRAIFDYWLYYPCPGEGEHPLQSLPLPSFEDPSFDPTIDPRLPRPRQCRRAIYRYEYTTNIGSKIPLAGVKVRARSWFKTRTALTDAQGNYYISFFRNQVNYSIKWERNDYDIRDGLLFQAYFTGPKKKGNWNVDLVSGKALRHATIHRAAHRYFYQNIGGLVSPTIFPGKLKLAYLDKKGKSQYWLGTWFVFPTLEIRGIKDDGTYWTTNAIFSTTIHEIAHASHSNLMGNIQFWQVDDLLIESWATAVMWSITRLEYNERGVADYDVPSRTLDLTKKSYSAHRQWWNNTFTKNIDYSPIFIDLVDNFNQTSGPFDHITGYTMRNIESNILTDSYGLTSLRTALQNNKPSGVSNADIDAYLTYYFNL